MMQVGYLTSTLTVDNSTFDFKLFDANAGRRTNSVTRLARRRSHTPWRAQKLTALLERGILAAALFSLQIHSQAVK